MINFKEIPNRRVQILLLTFLVLTYVLILFLVAFKEGYFHFKTENGVRTFINKSDSIFYDDKGYYLLKMIKLDNKEFITKQVWFNQIKDNISPYDLIKQWNYWGVKIKSLVTSSIKEVAHYTQVHKIK